MRDDHRTRIPPRGRPNSTERERDYQGRRDGYSRSRQGSSRSPPPRQDFRDDQGDLDYDDTGRGAGASLSRRDEHDYSGMYDEDGRGASDSYRQGHYGDDRDHRDRRGGYRDRDDPSARSSPRGYHTRSRSQSPTREAGRPSDTVILEGLPFTVSASELQESILRNSVAAEFPSIDVRVSSTKGNRRAFVQFESTDYAVTFIREHFPKLLLEMPQPTDEVPDGRYNVYLHYARSRDDTDHRASNSGSGGNWICSSCDFSNYPTRSRCKICGAPPSVGPDWQQSLTGQADAANVPSQILVIYPLAGFVNEDMLAGDMKRLELEKPNPAKDTSSGAPKLKSTAPTGNTSGYGAREGSLHRVFLMRDIYNDESFKYGFAEFWTVEDATAAIAKFQAARSFTVGAVGVNISTIHMGVFLPEERELTPDIERMSFNPLFNPSLRVRYRDHRLWPSERVVTVEPPNAGGQSKTSAGDTQDSKKSKKRKAEGSLPSTNKKPVAMAGQMAMWQRKHDELHGQDGGERGPSEQGDSSRRSPDKESTGPIKISLAGAKIGGGAPAEGSKRSTSPDKPGPAQAEPAKAKEAPPLVSYVDRERLMCLICMRKYKSVDEVNIHEKSRNHKTATDDPELVKAAQPRLAARDKRLQKQGTAPEEATPSGDATSAESQYRDRAKERRQVYQQPKKPSAPAPPKASDTTNKSKPPKADEAPTATKPPQPSKGAGMLAKMGWTTGAGLGANGEGRTEVIEQNAYQEGVGLGAEGSNLGDAAQLAERKTKNSYAEYVSTVQDRARERYNKLD